MDFSEYQTIYLYGFWMALVFKNQFGIQMTIKYPTKYVQSWDLNFQFQSRILEPNVLGNIETAFIPHF